MKKRIGFLLSLISDTGGIGRVTSIISEQINRLEDFEVHIISYVKGDTDYNMWNEEFSYHFLLENRISMKKGIFKATKNLRKVLTDNKIDILISCGQIVGPLGVCGTLFNTTKLLYWSHTSFKGASKKQFRMFNEHFTALFAKCTITLTKTDEVNYKKETLSRKVVQIYNPIDSKLGRFKKTYNAETKKIISVGRLQYEKNFEIIPEIMNILIRKHPTAEWHIYGCGGYHDKLQNLILENNLKNSIILMGHSNKLYDLYNDYSLMVMTSRYEGFPMSLLEGLASQLPLISFNVPTGPNEIIIENLNGHLIEPFDKEDMANKIISLFDNPKKMQKYSENNQNLLSEFNLEHIITKWVVLLNET
jgi:glycosyltransferase involved in cell wall biosynthesis